MLYELPPDSAHQSSQLWCQLVSVEEKFQVLVFVIFCWVVRTERGAIYADFQNRPGFVCGQPQRRSIRCPFVASRQAATEAKQRNGLRKRASGPSWIQTAARWASAVILLDLVVLQQWVLTTQRLESWAWWIPFFIGAAGALAAMRLCASMGETGEFQKVRKTENRRSARDLARLPHYASIRAPS